jgi:tight adherence protein B
MGATVTGTLPVAILLGLGTSLGLLIILIGLFRPTPDPAAISGHAEPARWLAALARWQDKRRPGDARRMAVAVAVGLVAAVMTGWPVAGVLAALAVWSLPSLIGPDRDHRRRLARIEAVAGWTESLRDTLGAAAGLEQAIVATATMAPAPIRDEVTHLAQQLQRGHRLADALRVFAVEVDDATADLVVTALVMAAERNARHIGELLTSLATAARDQASLRMRVAATRARVRTSTRVITIVTTTMAGGLLILNRPYLHPYDSPLGQLLLIVVGACFGVGFAWLGRIGRFTDPPRLLHITTAASTVEDVRVR